MKEQVKSFWTIILILAITAISPTGAFAQKGGIIAGTVVDKTTGEPLISATIRVAGTKLGTKSKIDGSYRIANVPAGTYSLVFSYLGYRGYEVKDVVVKSGEVTTIEAPLQDEAIMKDEVVVTAKAEKTTGAALLKQRQKADAVSDAIGAEEIARGGSGDAADAIKKVTGATTVGGKHVYIRGLGERYSSTQLNGANLPSADPDKKSVHLDLFPSGMIENITTIKTATPDKPGDFTGGTVDIKTKSFPDKFKASVSLSSAYNLSRTGDDMLTYAGSDTDWLGYDDGTREIPNFVKNVIDSKDKSVPFLSQAFADKEKAYLLNDLSKAFSPVMAPDTKTMPVDHSFSVSVGDNLFNQKLGYLASFSYGRKYDSYDDGVHAIYLLPGQITDSSALNKEVLVSDQKSVDEVVWGSMMNLAYNVSPNHRVGFNYMYNQSGTSETRYQSGYDRYYGDNLTYETRVLKWVERSINSIQFNGKHNFDFFEDSKLDWLVSYSDNVQSEPDLRFFTNDYIVDRNDPTDTTFNIDQSLYKFPSRYFRDLTEDNLSANLDFEFPFKNLTNLNFKFKTGYSYQKRTREFREHRFDIAQDKANYDGRPTEFFVDYTGIIDSSNNFYRFGNYIQYYNPLAASYDGDQEISAYYAMIDWFVTDKIRIIGGARYESTDMNVRSLDSTKADRAGILDNQDLLPSMNFVYQLSDEMNIRGAFGKTLARPNFRELAPYSSFEYVGGYIFLGNDSLKRTLIDNYDLRWEWFLNPGEIVAFSGFYKDFSNPIERTIINVNDEIKYKNVNKASLYGFEFELRKTLGFIDPMLEQFQFGANFTYVFSEVDISEEELKEIRQFDPNASSTRELQGQSPFVLNLDLSYVNWESGTDANLHFYVFGKRLSEVTQQGTPDIYEYPRPDLNLVVSQKLMDSFKIKLSAKNLLNANYEKAQEFRGKKYIVQDYQLGTVLSLSFSYAID